MFILLLFTLFIITIVRSLINLIISPTIKFKIYWSKVTSPLPLGPMLFLPKINYSILIIWEMGGFGFVQLMKISFVQNILHLIVVYYLKLYDYVINIQLFHLATPDHCNSPSSIFVYYLVHNFMTLKRF